MLNYEILTVYTIQISTCKSSSESWVIMAPYKIKKKGYLLRSYFVDAQRVVLFMAEQVFLPTGSSGQCIMHVHNAQ